MQTRWSSGSRGLVGAAELGVMKPTAYLLNTSRGPIVDEPRCTADGLDAHLGCVTTGNYARFFGDVVADIAGCLRGGPVNVV
jgi:lactate dehydrogenase-like 2-hydroxyacid dehydrogenase